jgi:hypothetical protein
LDQAISLKGQHGSIIKPGLSVCLDHVKGRACGSCEIVKGTTRGSCSVFLHGLVVRRAAVSDRHRNRSRRLQESKTVWSSTVPTGACSTPCRFINWVATAAPADRHRNRSRDCTWRICTYRICARRKVFPSCSDDSQM